MCAGADKTSGVFMLLGVGLDTVDRGTVLVVKGQVGRIGGNLDGMETSGEARGSGRRREVVIHRR